MEYKPKVVLCRLHMAGKSIQQIREECAGQGIICTTTRRRSW